jgi:nucleoside-triphosphatase THEP1
MGFVSQDISQFSNEHIWLYLRYYLRMEAQPKYAVMIDGPWGAGKSHLVQRIIDDHFRGWKDQYVKVSLFGLSSVAEIDEALFAAIYPMLNSPGAHLVGGVMKAGLSYLTASTEVRLQKLLSNKKAQVYIFDDLERCELEVSKVLGYINSFVEHGARVIIIGDQSRLKVTQNADALERYDTEREKLVGKTLKVEPSFEEAFDAFVQQMSNTESRLFVTAHSNLIRLIFEQSATKNLRLLQLTLWDFERIFSGLDARHKANDEAMRVLTGFFFALSIEVKRGRLDEHELKTRDNGLATALRRHYSGDKKAEADPMNDAAKQYPAVDLRDEMLPNGVLVDILFNGLVDDTAIGQALDRSRFFAQKTNQPAWLRLLHVFDLTDEEFEATLTEVEQQLDRHEITIPGALLHVVSSRLMLASWGVLSNDVAAITEESINYLDELYAEGKLTIHDHDSEMGLGTFAYAGYAFSESSSDEFQKVKKHLKSLLTRSKSDRYPKQANELMDEMEQDANLFARKISLTNSPDNIFWNVPLLVEIAPQLFCARLLCLPPPCQGTVLRALHARYEIEEVREKELKSEIPWLITVRLELLAESANLPRLSRQRIKWLIEHTLDRILPQTVPSGPDSTPPSASASSL